MAPADTKTPVTCFTGFLGAGKTTTILGLLKQLPKDYKCVLLKNEYGDVEVDSLLAEQSNITGVSEILNGCLCCTMVGLVDNAMLEIKEKYNPDRIIIESSGSAMPATLALRIREMEPQGFRLDGVVTVVDCKNFPGYEDTSPSAKLQAKYTDLLLLSKHELCTESEMDTLHDRLSALNEDTPRIKISKDTPIDPEVLFGLDTQLFAKTHDEGLTWDEIAGKAGWHGDEVETKSVWKGGKRPGSEHKHDHAHGDGESCECHDHDHDHEHPRPHSHLHSHDHSRANGEANGEASEDTITPISRGVLRKELGKLNFEIYRVKGIVRLPPMGTDSARGWETYILNWAFGRSDLTRMPALDDEPSLKGVSLRLTVMGERGEVARRARALAEGLKAEIA